MFIKGFQKTTLLDYPSKVAATVFTGGCNFRCPFCHNASLVTHVDTSESISEDSVLKYLEKRKGILDGICITGGEPLLQNDLADFCQRVHELGLLIKLDTNGALHDRLSDIISKGLVDYVAMDVKNSPELYADTVGLKSLPAGVLDSMQLIMNCGIDYEFRTTVVRQLHTKESIDELCRHISGAKRYYLQVFADSGDLISDGLSAYSEEEMRELLEIAKVHVPSAQLRGI